MTDLPKIKEEIAETPAPAPKKRGRKRKSEIALQQQIEEIIEVPQEETVSRRGRPRKKVNYYELANPDNIEFPVQLEKQVKYYSIENEETKNNKKRKIEKNSSLIETSDSSLCKVEVTLNQSEKNNFSESNDDVNGKHKQDSTDLNGTEEINNSVSENVTMNLEDSTTGLEATTSTPNKDKKYNYTGETVKMMNTLFNLFTDEKSDQKSTSNDSNTVEKNSNNGKRSYRKPKKYNVVNEEELDDGTGNVTCAVCNTTLDKSLWSHHKQRYHNNLAWRVGDTPLDLNDQSFVMHTLNMLYKKKKPLYCDKCGEVKKSVVGFLSHRSQCLKSEEQLESVKVACELCGRKMLPVSMSTHMKMLHQNPEKAKDVGELKNDVHKPLPSKRSAAKKALRIIETVTKHDDKERYFSSNLDLGSQEFARTLMQKELDETQFFECKFNCNCITTNMEDALKHIEECTEKPSQGFVCKQCLLIFRKLEDTIYHVEFTHDLNVGTDGDNDDPSFSEKESGKLPSFLYTTIRRHDRVLFPFAFQWTHKFCEENFADYLYENLCYNKSDWPLLSPTDVVKYLPTLNESCDVAYTHVTCFKNVLENDYTFKKYKLFETDIQDNKITIFCGGPVSSMAWLPTPYTKETENQILAVSVLNSPDAKFDTCGNFHVNSAVQFWNFGPVCNKKNSLQEPKLVFGLAHNHGPVWHMEWCPSGCYGEDRLGLLAVAGSDSVVYIYSVPFIKDEEIGLYYKAKAVMKLYLQRPETPLLGGLKYYPSRISWSKALGHQCICVGYTNGFVALFNLKNNSVILKFKDAEGIPCILPNKCFQAHSHAVTALTLHYLNNGTRWLMTGSFDRRVCIWDLDNLSYPVCNFKKNMVTDGFWFTNWLCYVSTCDEGSTSNFITTMMKQVRDYVCDPNVTLACSATTISAVSGSDWLNGILHANTVGEIVALFPHQILYNPEYLKVLKPKRMLFGYTSLVEKQKTPAERVEDDKNRKKVLQNLSAKKLSAGVKLSNIKPVSDSNSLFINESVLYDEVQEKYALLFCDNRMKSYEDFPKTTPKQLTALSKTYGNTYPNQYPLSTINKIVFNPNRQASLYYATGYQAGFVRISWMEFLKGDHQIK